MVFNSAFKVLNEFSSVLSLSEMFREVLNLTKHIFPSAST